METGFRERGGERGIALVMALVSLLVVAVIAILLMTSLNVERKLTGHDVRDAQALNFAEAGVGEAMARLRNSDIVLPPTNPRAVAQIFLTTAGSVPVLGTDSVAVETKQPAGAWLTYSTATKSKDALTVEFKTNSARTVIYRYDTTKNPPVQTTTGLPIYRITSTGQKGANRARIVTEAILKPFVLNIKAAVAANVNVKFTGNAVICGYNHSVDTPTNAGDPGRSVPGGCNENPGLNRWELGSSDLVGIWTTGVINNGGAAQPFGSPSSMQQSQTGFYAGPWESLTMSQAEFYQWIGAPRATEPSNINGMVYLDNNSTTQDRSGSFAFHGKQGEGFLYVDGDLTLNSTFTYRGLVYVEGDLKLNGSAWILGALIVRGSTELKANGGATVLYSGDAIQQALAKASGQFVTLSWRQVPLD